MKTEELTALGVEKEVAAQILAINGKDIEKAKASKEEEIKMLTKERDGYKVQLDTAAETLKKFDGINPEQIQSELETYKTRAEESEKNFKREIMLRDQKDWLKAKLDEYGVKSPLARKQIVSEVMDDKKGLKWQESADGKTALFMGFGDYMKAAKEEDNTLYLTEEEEAAQEEAAKLKENAPTFTGHSDSGGATGGGRNFTPPKIF